MGACVSSTADSIDKSTCAFVISMKGELREYTTPIFVSEVLQPDSFVCNSDSLYYDQHVPALGPEDELDAGQIYFVLPNTMHGHVLSASDMAALAVKASVALDSKLSSKRIKNNNAQILPFVLMETAQIKIVIEEDDENKLLRKNCGLRVSRLGSIRKRPRYTSKKGLRAVRSFKIRLSTIYENERYEELQT